VLQRSWIPLPFGFPADYAQTAFPDSILRAASARSDSLTILYRLKTSRVLCPLILMATTSGSLRDQGARLHLASNVLVGRVWWQVGQLDQTGNGIESIAGGCGLGALRASLSHFLHGLAKARFILPTRQRPARDFALLRDLFIGELVFYQERRGLRLWDILGHLKLQHST
jgi:hypothetical protein